MVIITNSLAACYIMIRDDLIRTYRLYQFILSPHYMQVIPYYIVRIIMKSIGCFVMALVLFASPFIMGPLPVSWIIAGWGIGILFVILGYALATIPGDLIQLPTRESIYSTRTQNPIRKPEPEPLPLSEEEVAEDSDDFVLMEGAKIESTVNGVKLITKEGPKFLLCLLDEDKVWAQQIDALDHYILPSMTDTKKGIVKQIRNRVKHQTKKRVPNENA